MDDEYIYRVTRRRPNPSYYKSAHQTGLHSKRSLSAILKSVLERYDHYERYKDKYDLKEPGEQIVKIERSRLGPFEDVTSEYITLTEAGHAKPREKDD